MSLTPTMSLPQMTPMTLKLKLSLTLAGTLLLLQPLSAFAQPAPPHARPAPSAVAPTASAAPARVASPRPARYREIKWEDLVPADWDPMKDLRGLNFNILSDADPRAVALLKRMREVWDAAPVNNQMNEIAVRLPGYVVPLEENKDGMTEFLLVPYYGACIHTPPPPANQILHVAPNTPARNLKSMDTVWVSGILRTLRTDSYMGVSGYRLEAFVVEPYVEPRR